MMRNKTRQTNIELLRIISMLMIITLHFLTHGDVFDKVDLFSPNYFIAWIFEGICYISVNCFVLISGYFLVNSKFKLEKLLTIIFQVLFFSIVIYFLLFALGLIDFSPKDALFSFIPTLSGRYWFVTMYIGMYIISPFLNLALKAMNKKTHLILIAMLVLLFSIIPNFMFFSKWLDFGGGTGVVWFLTLYTVAAYFRLYGSKIRNIKNIILCCIGSLALIPISKFLIALLSKTLISNYVSTQNILKGSDIFYKYNSILVFTASVLTFIVFLNIKINNKAINKIILFFSPLTFGVYLIHDNNQIRTLLWDFVRPTQYLVNYSWPFIMIATVFVIFIICSLIEFLRIKLFGILHINNLINIICNKSKKLYNKTLKLFTNK